MPLLITALSLLLLAALVRLRYVWLRMDRFASRPAQYALCLGAGALVVLAILLTYLGGC